MLTAAAARGAAAEAALLRKDGQMAIAKTQAYEAPPSRLGRKQPAALPEPCRRLYREPALPVVVGAQPGGSAVSLRGWPADTRDWRRLPAASVRKYFEELQVAVQVPINRIYPQQLRRPPEESQHFEGLMTAVAVGTLQACRERCYWVDSGGEAPASECRGLRSPLSRALFDTPELPRLEPGAEAMGKATLCPDRNALDVCRDLAADRSFPRVGLVRFVPLGDERCCDLYIGDFRESALLLRTSYLEALQEMPRQLHGAPTKLLEQGAVIHTSDVSILRGPVEEGAPWLPTPTTIEVLTVALLRHPRCDDQAQYARTSEKAQTAAALDRVFANAAALGIDVLVLQPPGVGGASGCHHPAEDAGDLLKKAIAAHERHVPRVWVCQEHATQLKPLGCWDAFASALEGGRTPPTYNGLIPLSASPYVRPGWAPSARKSHRVPLGSTILGRACGASGSGAQVLAAKPLQSESPRAAATARSAVLESVGRAVAC